MLLKNRKMITLVWISFILLALLASGCSKQSAKNTASTAEPEALKQVEELNAAADDMYNKLVQGDVNTARTKLNEIGDKLTQIRFNGIATVEGVQALTGSVIEAKRELNAAAYTKMEGQQAAARVRLATDALTHKNEPMWLQYYKGMKESVSSLQHAVQASKAEEAKKSLAGLSEQYKVIRPSVIINRTPSEVERLESLFSFMNTQLNAAKWDTKNIIGGIDHLNKELDKIFQRKDAEAFVPIVEPSSPTLGIAFLGSIIVAVLAFAAWRIFKVERNIVGGRSWRNRNDKFLK
jgi:sporulation protein YpjB